MAHLWLILKVTYVCMFFSIFVFISIKNQSINSIFKIIDKIFFKKIQVICYVQDFIRRFIILILQLLNNISCQGMMAGQLTLLNQSEAINKEVRSKDKQSSAPCKLFNEGLFFPSFSSQEGK